MTKITSLLVLHHILPYGSIINLPQLNPSPLSALFVLIGISIIVAASFLAAFLWSVNHGQYDDDYTPSIRMLFDDETKPPTADLTSSIKP
jgi:cbb3-type cytochrome oxidase maturation protein